MVPKKRSNYTRIDKKAEISHFMKHLNDLGKMETMKETINTTLFLEKEREDIEKHILNAKIRTSRNLYWQGKLLKLESLIDDIPELLKRLEAEVKEMVKGKNKN